MHQKNKFITVAAITLLATGVFTATAVRAVFYAPDPEASVPASVVRNAPAAATSPKEYPARLRIPALGIDTNVLQVGIGKSGNMAVPPNFTDVGWYKYGTVPGAMGSAVIDGHVDNGLGMPGVFKNLANIQPGDAIYITTKGGSEIQFIVESTQAYPHNDVPLDVVFNQADDARLNLITCEGVWVPGEKTYDHRFVVFAKKV